jgi:hypothetical protein
MFADSQQATPQEELACDISPERGDP